MLGVIGSPGDYASEEQPEKLPKLTAKFGGSTHTLTITMQGINYSQFVIAKKAVTWKAILHPRYSCVSRMLAEGHF